LFFGSQEVLDFVFWQSLVPLFGRTSGDVQRKLRPHHLLVQSLHAGTRKNPEFNISLAISPVSGAPLRGGTAWHQRRENA
jgi:hypothetical protein